MASVPAMDVSDSLSHASQNTILNTSLNPLASPFVPAPSTPRFPPRWSLKISQLNCRSLLNKMWYLENVLVPNWKSEILCLTETWLQPHSTMNTHLALPNYTMYRRDRPISQHGGGLVIYTLSDLCTVRRPDLEHSNIECIAIQITLSRNMKHFIFACYCPPNESPDVFFGTLSSLLDAASKESSYLTLLGDFNAKHSTWDSQTNTAGTRLFQLLLNFGLSQCVKQPTRFSSNLQSSSTYTLRPGPISSGM